MQSNLYYWDSTYSCWVGPEENKIKVRIVDSFLLPKYAEITISDLNHEIQDSGVYSNYARIKIENTVSSLPIFFGRVEFVEASNSSSEGPVLILQARDFLQELTENVVDRDFSGPSKIGTLIKNIIDYYTFTKIQYSGAGGFTVQEYDNSGNWIATATGRARLIHIDESTKTLVITDVVDADSFINGATITEYSDVECETATGVSDTQDGALYHNIDTSEIPELGDIEITTAKNFLSSSNSPLDAITNLCLHASSTATYHFFLEEADNESLFPQVFRLFARESRPASGPSANGLTIKYEGADSDQERAMYSDYSFPIPEREIYTEAMAFSSDSDNNLITSVKKAGEIAYELEIFKKRVYQDYDHYVQAGLNNSVDRFMALTGTESIQRGIVSITDYPYFFVYPDYHIVHATEMVHVVNSRLAFTSSGVDMIITEIQYEEPQGSSTIALLQTTYGVGPPEYTYPEEMYGTELPPSRDARVMTSVLPNIPWSDYLPKAVQGYHHDITFTAVDDEDISIGSGGTIEFYDGTSQAIEYIGTFTETTYTIPGAGIYYVYFDLDDTHPNTLLVTNDYLSVMDSKTGLVCLIQKGSAVGIKASVIPSYGKEPLITPDFIDMTGIRSYPFDEGYSEYSYIQSIRSTQISSGWLKLTSDSVFDGKWYQESGVIIDASAGISIYGTDMAFATFKDLTDYGTGTYQCKVDSNGYIVAGAGNVVLNSDGIQIYGEMLDFYDTETIPGQQGAIWGYNSGTAGLAVCGKTELYFCLGVAMADVAYMLLDDSGVLIVGTDGDIELNTTDILNLIGYDEVSVYSLYDILLYTEGGVTYKGGITISNDTDHKAVWDQEIHINSVGELVLNSDTANIRMSSTTITVSSTGDLWVLDDIDCDGVKNCAMKVSEDKKVLFSAIESPNVWFEDKLSGKIKNNICRIDLDQRFIDSIDTSYLNIVVTPTSDCGKIWVEKGETFVIVHGEYDGSFDVTISAKRKGYSYIHYDEKLLDKETNTWYRKSKEKTWLLEKKKILNSKIKEKTSSLKETNTRSNVKKIVRRKEWN